MLAEVAKLVDALDLGSSVERRAGSIPVLGTIIFSARPFVGLATRPFARFGPGRRQNAYSTFLPRLAILFIYPDRYLIRK